MSGPASRSGDASLDQDYSLPAAIGHGSPERRQSFRHSIRASARIRENKTQNAANDGRQLTLTPKVSGSF
jgi:hypothetical protein